MLAQADPLDSIVDIGGKSCRWRDLQLPLYAIFLKRHFGQMPQCGYFVLPKAVTETAVHTWPELNSELLAAAENCAAAIARAIRGGVFWPPAETPAFDDFAVLFHGSASDSIAPGSIPGLEGVEP